MVKFDASAITGKIHQTLLRGMGQFSALSVLVATGIAQVLTRVRFNGHNIICPRRLGLWCISLYMQPINTVYAKYILRSQSVLSRILLRTEDERGCLQVFLSNTF
jgi:hypothetical protein